MCSFNHVVRAVTPGGSTSIRAQPHGPTGPSRSLGLGALHWHSGPNQPLCGPSTLRQRTHQVRSDGSGGFGIRTEYAEWNDSGTRLTDESCGYVFRAVRMSFRMSLGENVRAAFKHRSLIPDNCALVGNIQRDGCSGPGPGSRARERLIGCLFSNRRVVALWHVLRFHRWRLRNGGRFRQHLLSGSSH